MFTRAVTPIPRTTQALASMFTGQYPQKTRVRRLTSRLPDTAMTLGRLAQQRGYQTAAVVSNHLLTRARGLDNGFDSYDFANDTRGALRTTRAALGVLSSRETAKPLLLWVHYIDPHVPYYPSKKSAVALDPDYQGKYQYHFGQVQGGIGNKAYPEDLPKAEAVFENELPERVNEHIRRLYAADIRDTDEQLALLFDAVEGDASQKWWVLFTSDHGESLGEHDFYFDHGDYVYDACMRIPLAVRAPAGHPLGKAQRIDARVSLIDVLPTLIDLLAWKVEERVAGRFDGISLAGLMRGEKGKPRPLFGECGMSYFPKRVERRKVFDVSGRFRAVWLDEWKLIFTPYQSAENRFELYRLDEDPAETRNLAPEHPEVVSRLFAELRQWMKEDPELRKKTLPELSDDDRQRLRSLGYVQ